MRDEHAAALGGPRAGGGNQGPLRGYSGATQMAVGQNQWYLFGVGAPPILVYFNGDRDVHWGYGILTHGHIPSFWTYIESTIWPFRSRCVEQIWRGPILRHLYMGAC